MTASTASIFFKHHDTIAAFPRRCLAGMSNIARDQWFAAAFSEFEADSALSAAMLVAASLASTVLDPSKSRKNISISGGTDVKRIEKTVLPPPTDNPTTLPYRLPGISWLSLPRRCILMFVKLGTG
jgi:hypothetical protein